MKKIFSAFVIAVCCMFMAMPAQAQLLKWGVKGGVNMTKIDWDGGYKGNKDNSTGFFIGPMAEFTIPIVGFLQIGKCLDPCPFLLYLFHGRLLTLSRPFSVHSQHK